MKVAWKTSVAAGVLFLGTFLPIFQTYRPSFQRVHEAMTTHRRLSEEYRGLIQRKDTIESAWRARRGDFQSDAASGDILNDWQKSLMSLAQADALIVHKLEPAGTKDDEAAMFVSFEGDILKFIQFIYRLLETEPLVRIKTFSLRQGDEHGNFIFEIMLGKVL